MTARVDGSLETLHAQVEANGDRIRARASADVTPFGEVPFTHLMVDGERINPRLFSATAPQANLSVHADLRPVAPAAAPASAPAAPASALASASASAPPASGASAKPTANATAPLTVAGEVTVNNLEPGPLDKERLPVQSVQARVELSEATQILSDLRIALLGKAEIVGRDRCMKGAAASTSMCAGSTWPRSTRA
jgi:translocation and assembly module TamB